MTNPFTIKDISLNYNSFPIMLRDYCNAKNISIQDELCVAHIYRVGFTNVSATDLTNEFIDILKLELEKFKPKKAEFVKVFEIHFVSAQFMGIIRFDMETCRFTHNSHF